MVFSGVTFLFYFLPLVLLLYFAVRKELKNFILLFSSLMFYMWGENIYVLILIFDIVINYAGGLLVSRYGGRKKSDIFLAINICMNLGLLFYYKYIDMTIDIINKVGSRFGMTAIRAMNVALPIGLSFFIFQGMSYVIDVYRKKVPVQKNILNIALYIAMFPQLIAGPIVRYSDIYRDIDERKVNLDNIYCGAKRFITGLGKKVIIADVLAVTADRIVSVPVEQLTPSIAWTGAVCYTLQIFFDFSGYSDMAIGLGKIFGFEFPENFNLPYTSVSVSEFWRRWHMSLSSWFKDYLYIPLGGNRKGNVYINLMIVFFCTGLWHGADYCFVFWGLWHGMFVVIEKVLKKHTGIKVPGILGWLYTMLVVITGWVFFQGRGIKYLMVMAGIYDHSFKWYTLPYYIDNRMIFTVILASLMSLGVFGKLYGKLSESVRNSGKMTVCKDVGLAVILFISIYMIVSGSYSPFIYFRF